MLLTPQIELMLSNEDSSIWDRCYNASVAENCNSYEERPDRLRSSFSTARKSLDLDPNALTIRWEETDQVLPHDSMHYYQLKIPNV
jgi:hypothetical protein